MRIRIIAAVSQNGVMGIHGRLPWHLPDDEAFLAHAVRGQVAVMGRISYEGFRPLAAETRCLVLSRTPGLPLLPGHRRVPDFAAAVAAARADAVSELLVLGGSAVYADALPHATAMDITRVLHDFVGDAWFPQVHWHDWELLAAEPHPADARHAYAFRFEHYARRT